MNMGRCLPRVHPFTSAMESSPALRELPPAHGGGLRLFTGGIARPHPYLGGKYVVIHGQPLGHGALSDREYWERFGQLTHFTRDTGARPAQENVRNLRASDPAFLGAWGSIWGRTAPLCWT